MNHALVIARRELTERRFVFIAAAILATLPFTLAATPQAKQWGALHVVAVVGGFAAIGFMFALPIALGSSIISRELAEKRMSFYFSRPISAASIWFGKVLASLFTILACLAIILTPALLFAHRAWKKGWNIPISAAVVSLCLSAITLFFLSHAVSTMLRSRSKWFVLDIGMTIYAAGALWLIIVPILEAMAMRLAGVMVGFLGTSMLIILSTAGWWQLARGRIDRVRNHVELSKYVWISLTAVIIGLAIFAMWVRSASPDDLTSDIDGEQQRNGSWMLLTGQSRGRMDYLPSFLLDSASGKFTRLGAAPYNGHAFSRDGKVVVWNEPLEVKGPFLAVMTRRLDQPDARPVDTGIRMKRMAALELSDDGSRLAVVESGGLLTVYDLATSASLGSAMVPVQSAGGGVLYFVNPGLVRMYVRPLKPQPGDLRTIRILEYDIAARKMTITGAFPTPAKFQMFNANADGSRVIVRNGTGADPARTVELLDGRTGALIAPLPIAADAEIGIARFLADGRMVMIEKRGGEGFVRQFGPDAQPLRETSLGRMYRALLESDLGNGKLLAAVAEQGDQRAGAKAWKAVVVDVNRGAIEREERDLRPNFLGFYRGFGDPRYTPAAPNQAFVFRTMKGNVVTWNPSTGEKKALIE